MLTGLAVVLVVVGAAFRAVLRAREAEAEALHLRNEVMSAAAVAERAQRALQKAARPCPDCGEYAALSGHVGELDEDVCVRCHGRLLNPDATGRLLLEHHGFTLSQLQSLRADPMVRMVVCPACRRHMVPRRVRGAVVQLCGTCGHSWLSAADFVTLSEGRFEAVLPRQS